MRSTRFAGESNSTNAMAHLLQSYVHGEIREPTWDRFMDLIDSDQVVGSDREALATFLCDALEDDEGDAVYVPLVTEAENLLLDAPVDRAA